MLSLALRRRNLCFFLLFGLLRLLFCLIERYRILICLSYCFGLVGFYSGRRFRFLRLGMLLFFCIRCPLRHIFCPDILALRPGCFSGVYAEFLQDAFYSRKIVGFRADLIEQFFSRCLICPLTLQQRLLFRRPHLWGCIFAHLLSLLHMCDTLRQYRLDMVITQGIVYGLSVFSALYKTGLF